MAELYNLEELRTDIVRSKPLPQEYSNLKMLQRLIFIGRRSNVISLSNNIFNAFSALSISEINLNGLDIGIISRQTFSNLSSLRQLGLSNNPRIHTNLGTVAESLGNTSIRILKLNNTGIGNSPNPTTILKQFCNLPLEELTIDGNFIHFLDPIFRDCFSNLILLSLADNYLFPYFRVFQDLMFIDSLVGLNISYQYKLSDSDLEDDKTYDKELLGSRQGKGHLSLKDMACPIAPAPKLEWIDVSNSGLLVVNILELVLQTNSSLKYLSVLYCGVQTISLPVYCPRIVEMLDFSNNNLQYINASVFNKSLTNCDWGSLKRFYLRNNKLGQMDGNICNKDRSNVFGFLGSQFNSSGLIKQQTAVRQKVKGSRNFATNTRIGFVFQQIPKFFLESQEFHRIKKTGSFI